MCRCINHVERRCLNCDRAVLICKYRVARFKFCGRKCRSIFNARTNPACQTGERTLINCGQCGKDFTVSNYRKTTARYCSIRCQTTANIRYGKENNWWRGGVTPINRRIRTLAIYKKWRKAVFERDGYKCVWCGEGGELNADHIKQFAFYPELRFEIKNGRTLCIDCHKKTETFARRINV